MRARRHRLGGRAGSFPAARNVGSAAADETYASRSGVGGRAMTGPVFVLRAVVRAPMGSAGVSRARSGRSSAKVRYGPFGNLGDSTITIREGRPDPRQPDGPDPCVGSSTRGEESRRRRFRPAGETTSLRQHTVKVSGLAAPGPAQNKDRSDRPEESDIRRCRSGSFLFHLDAGREENRSTKEHCAPPQDDSTRHPSC